MIDDLREGDDEDKAAEETIHNAYYSDDLKRRMIVPVNIGDICIAGQVLMDSKMTVKTMKVSMETRKK